ncbi:unnamed protein product [Candida verbasci]|uniref:Uncharacterized protein n=1 Tax=Candida verbasci TaxID=1227364 RepID=A0A9W4XCB8_9ASCO|nr:unnamed protein product [Candida verbasci]
MTLTKYQRGDFIEGWNDCPNIFKLKNSTGDEKIRHEFDKLNTQHLTDYTEVLNKVLSLDYNNKISSKDLDLYKRKFEQIDLDSHLDFLLKILQQIYEYSQNKDKELQKKIKMEIVEYLTNHDGVSRWCSPLKRMITSL